MPRPFYRDRAANVEVGDFVRGWADAGATEEIAGVVVSVHSDGNYGSNVVLAVLDLDEHPEGAELEPDELPPGAAVFKNHQQRSALLTVRTIEAHADRLELVHRRADLPGHQGVLRSADPEAVRLRERDRESKRRQAEAQSFVPPRGQAPATNPITSAAPAPLPAMTEQQKAAAQKEDEARAKAEDERRQAVEQKKDTAQQKREEQRAAAEKAAGHQGHQQKK